MAGFANDTVYANNGDFSIAGSNKGSAANGLNTDGQMWIGTTSTNAGGTHISVGSITSPIGTITVGYASPNITLDIAGGAAAVQHLTGNTGGQLNPSANNFNILAATVAAGTTPITVAGSGSTLTINTQISQALAAADATKIGLSNFDNASFAVAATGFVSLNVVSLVKGGTGSALVDPNADRIMFWDDSAGAVDWLTAGTGLNITNTTLTATATGDVVGPGSATDNALVRFDGTTGKLIQNGVTTEDDSGNILQSAALSGAGLSYQLYNTSNTASSTAGILVTSGGSSADDAFFGMQIAGAQGYSLGIDNSDSDALIISNSSVGPSIGIPIMRSASTGEVTFPNTSAFSAGLTNAASNVTGDGTVYTIVFNSEIFDQNGDYDNTTGVYTAPVTAKVQLQSSCFLFGGTVISGSVFTIVTSNRVYNITQPYANGGVTGQISGCISTLADMDAADTAYVTIVATDSGGKIDDVLNTTAYTYFNGYIAC